MTNRCFAVSTDAGHQLFNLDPIFCRSVESFPKSAFPDFGQLPFWFAFQVIGQHCAAEGDSAANERAHQPEKSRCGLSLEYDHREVCSTNSSSVQSLSEIPAAMAGVTRRVYDRTYRGYQGGYSGGSEGGKMKAPGYVWLILPVWLVACASPLPPRASAAQIDAAETSLSNCLGQAAERLDDGKSDAATVGLAIEPVCAGQFYQLEALNGQGLNPAAYNLYLEKARPRALEFATGMVLRVRVLRAQQKSN
jgi:hypothetical protein